MVKISRFNFNKDMDSYLTRRKSTGSKSLFSKSIKEEKKAEERPNKFKIDPKTGKSLDPKYESRKSKRKDNYPTFGEKEEKEDFEAMDGDYERRPGFFARVIRIFTVPAEDGEDIDVDVEEEVETPTETEIKEVLRCTARWLKYLPPEDIEDIKDSEDFRRYKELLKKYNLIK